MVLFFNKTNRFYLQKINRHIFSIKKSGLLSYYFAPVNLIHSSLYCFYALKLNQVVRIFQYFKCQTVLIEKKMDDIKN